MEAFKPLLGRIAAGETLSRSDAEAAFDTILSGDVTQAQIGALLMGLRVRGESVDEITGAVASMRKRMLRVTAPADAIDIVGTGGDGQGTYNVSTLAAVIVAACGVPVAKHGNRAASSRSGSSDVLTALGVAIGLPAEGVERCIREAGLGFMMAQAHHAAMRHVGGPRAEIGTRTIFNLLGPLCNPAGVGRQVLGVFSGVWLQPLAEVLRNLGSDRVWVVHGSDELDELTTTGETAVVALESGAIRRFAVVPEDAGLPRAAPDALKGGDPAANAAALRAVVEGAANAYRDIALLNAAAGLVIAERAGDLREGVALAKQALTNGAARDTLDRLVAASNGSPAAA